MTKTRRIGILTGGELGSLKAKMAHGVMRYRDDVVVVIDEKYQGKTVEQINTYVNKRIPIVGDIYGAMEYKIDELLIGIAPPNGEIPYEWINMIQIAASHNIKITNGLHMQLSTDERFKDIDRRLIDDLRFRNYTKNVATGKAAKLTNNVVLTVGSDCASGKMTTALELWKACKIRGFSTEFIATGQTGMCIADKGIAIDAVVADFMSGVIENLVCESAENNMFVFVEGQGALAHSAYSGVSLGLLHGAAPNIVIFCHDISRKKLEYFDKEIVSMDEQISMVEKLASYQKKCNVLGISLFAEGVDEKEINRIIYEMETKYRIPVFAPLITGCDKMVRILEEYR